MSSIELNEENCIDLLKRYVDTGYKNSGSVSIKEGAVIHKYFRVLKKQEKMDEVKTNDIYKILFKVVNVFNTNKSYSLDDAAVLDKVIVYIEENVLKTDDKFVEKIKEI